MKEKARILVVDDEPSVADALRLILEDQGYSVVVATTGREGIEQARASSFNLVITDLRLPDMTGLDVLKILCEQDPRCPAILISAHATPEVCAQALAGGAVGVLPKPFAPSEILRLITKALAARL